MCARTGQPALLQHLHSHFGPTTWRSWPSPKCESLAAPLRRTCAHICPSGPPAVRRTRRHGLAVPTRRQRMTAAMAMYDAKMTRFMPVVHALLRKKLHSSNRPIAIAIPRDCWSAQTRDIGAFTSSAFTSSAFTSSACLPALEIQPQLPKEHRTEKVPWTHA